MSEPQEAILCTVCGEPPKHPICGVHRYGDARTPVAEPTPSPRKPVSCACGRYKLGVIDWYAVELGVGEHYREQCPGQPPAPRLCTDGTCLDDSPHAPH